MEAGHSKVYFLPGSDARTEHSEWPLCLQRGQTRQPGPFPEIRPLFAETLSGGLLDMVSLEGEGQGPDNCCSFLSSYGPPARARPAHRSVLPSTSVKCQEHLPRQQTVLREGRSGEVITGPLVGESVH